MVPAQTPLRQMGAAPRSRLVCIEMVHGAAGQHPLRRRSKLLEPRKSGVNLDLSYSLELLHAFREYLTIVGRLRFSSGAGIRVAEGV